MHSLSDKLVVFVGGESPTKGYLFLALVLFITILIAITVAGPSHDPREPPLIRPRLPVFGHLLGLVRNRVSYFNDVFDEHGLPIATLPIVNKKLYVIFSAPIQQNAMRAKTMDAQSLTVEFIPRLFGVRKKTLDMLLGRDGIHEDMTPSMLKVFQTTLAPGCQPLNKMTSNALVQVAKALNEIDAEGIRIPNLFMWLRSMMSYAVSTGLFGHQHNPYGHGLEIIDAQWLVKARCAGIFDTREQVDIDSYNAGTLKPASGHSSSVFCRPSSHAQHISLDRRSRTRYDLSTRQSSISTTKLVSLSKLEPASSENGACRWTTSRETRCQSCWQPLQTRFRHSFGTLSTSG